MKLQDLKTLTDRLVREQERALLHTRALNLVLNGHPWRYCREGEHSVRFYQTTESYGPIIILTWRQRKEEPFYLPYYADRWLECMCKQPNDKDLRRIFAWVRQEMQE